MLGLQNGDGFKKQTKQNLQRVILSGLTPTALRYSWYRILNNQCQSKLRAHCKKLLTAFVSGVLLDLINKGIFDVFASDLFSSKL